MTSHPSVLRLVLRTRFHLLIWLVGSSAAAFLFITPFPVGQATRQGSSTYYVCDCGAEADVDCQAGDDNNDGTTVEIRGNELVRSSVDGSGLCQGVSLVGHGVLRDMLIEGNYVHEPVGGAGQGCWGIAITPAYSTGEGS